MKYVRAFVTFNVSANEWVVHVRKGRSFWARNRTEAIDCALASLKANEALRLVW
jgi:hypothetical protein